ncbi:hypothetical protein DR864_12045 [Runella rosea]|uniref:Collagen triple helix repeat-containing protein n=1 Tax=Runella rosea TaxID=2259595 RepID=A0A344TIF9_9BACT|nr:hypothetical protein DR864_12045 [Runella rosea]
MALPVGPAGPAGPSGPTGPTWPTAPVGPAGPAGPTAPAGPSQLVNNKLLNTTSTDKTTEIMDDLFIIKCVDLLEI